MHYGVDPVVGSNPATVLDVTERERDTGTAADPWADPRKSEAVQALLILIAHAMAHTLPADSSNDTDLDLRLFCADVELTDRQTEVVLMVAEGWGILAIADMLEITRQAVSKHLSIARCKLTRLVPPIDAYYRESFPQPPKKVAKVV